MARNDANRGLGIHAKMEEWAANLTPDAPPTLCRLAPPRGVGRRPHLLGNRALPSSRPRRQRPHPDESQPSRYFGHRPDEPVPRPREAQVGSDLPAYPRRHEGSNDRQPQPRPPAPSRKVAWREGQVVPPPCRGAGRGSAESTTAQVRRSAASMLVGEQPRTAPRSPSRTGLAAATARWRAGERWRHNRTCEVPPPWDTVERGRGAAREGRRTSGRVPCLPG